MTALGLAGGDAMTVLGLTANVTVLLLAYASMTGLSPAGYYDCLGTRISLTLVKLFDLPLNMRLFHSKL